MVTADELGNQGMTIQSLSFKATGASDSEGDYPNFNLYMGHTSLSDLTATFDDNWATSGTLVLSDPAVELTGITGDQWFTFELADPFQYDGTSNLLMEVTWEGTSLVGGSIYTWCWIGSGNRTVTAGEASSATGLPGAICQQLKLDYDGMALEQTTFAGIKSSF